MKFFIFQLFFEREVKNNMKKILIYLSFLFILVACSNENGDDTIDITKDFVEENAEIGLTYDEVRERFGAEELSDIVDNTETWLYDSTQYNNFDYDKSLEAVSHDEIKSGNLEYQLYINMDEKAFMYSYFYLEDDGKVWQYQVIPNAEPLNIPVSN